MVKIIKTVLFFCLTLAILVNLWWLKSSALGLIFGLTYLGCGAYILGSKILPLAEKLEQVLIGLWGLAASYCLIGALVYYFYQLNLLAVSLIFLITSLLLAYFYFKTTSQQQLNLNLGNIFSIFKNRLQLRSLALIFSYLILIISSFIILYHSQVIKAINSPWQVIPSSFFIIYFLASLNLLLLLWSEKILWEKLSLVLCSIHFFLTIGLALIIYKLGFGFDPFIHQATELAIFNQGFILPKPLYYLGQYSLVIYLANLLQISVSWIDKILVPILLAGLLPATIYLSLNKTFIKEKNLALILNTVFLSWPFGLFIVTTPQALANLFCLAILFLSFRYLTDKSIPLYFLIVLALASLAIHALAGIPALIYLLIVWLSGYKTKIAKISLAIFSLLAAFSLPLALLFNSFISIYKINFDWQKFTLLEWPTIFSQQFNYFLDIAYLYKFYLPIIFIITALIAFIYLLKKQETALFISALITFIILASNAILLNFIKVSFIIDYEQGEFSKRVWQIAFYSLLPLVIYALYLLCQKLKLKPFVYISFLLITLTLSLTLSLYLSYPRFDDYDNSKFVNLDQYDLAAVKFIESNSQGQPYIVLANQMTSAAALQTFGFSRYYKGQYFYPIPTGEKLYSYFEQMIYNQPEKKIMEQAMELSGVNLGYFVLPAYWSRFTIIKEQAQKSADDSYSLDDKILIFKYQLNK